MTLISVRILHLTTPKQHRINNYYALINKFEQISQQICD
jgi:hypothetical protein